MSGSASVSAPSDSQHKGTMSDSGDEDAGAGGEKKNFMYKIKALKRRTVHAVAKAAGKAEQTKDPEFDELYERFDEVRAVYVRCVGHARHLHGRDRVWQRLPGPV